MMAESAMKYERDAGSPIASYGSGDELLDGPSFDAASDNRSSWDGRCSDITVALPGALSHDGSAAQAAEGRSGGGNPQLQQRSHSSGCSRVSSKGPSCRSSFRRHASRVSANSGGNDTGNETSSNRRQQQRRSPRELFGAADAAVPPLRLHPVWLTFRDSELEAKYTRWFYEDSGFVGGKVWAVLVVLLDIWFLTYYHKNFSFSTIFTSADWAPMSFHIVFSALMGISLFFRPWARFRELIYSASLASHWPSVTIAIVKGKHPHSFIYFYIILCYFFCAFNAQARFSRVVWFLLLVPVVTLFAITFPFSYWETHSHLEVIMWLYVLPPMILLREFETISRHAFLTIRSSQQGIQAVKDQMATTHTLLNNLFPKTATNALIHSAVSGCTSHASTYAAAVLVVTDIEGFTKWCSATRPLSIVEGLARLFARMDDDAQCFGVEKVALVGDSFVGAVFAARNEVQALFMDVDEWLETSLRATGGDAASASLDQRQHASAMRVLSAFMFGLSALKIPLPLAESTRKPLRMRVGIHIGDCVGSFVGSAPLTYDIFGKTVAEAKHLEQFGLAGHVHASRRCRDLVDHLVTFVNPVEVDVPGVEGLAGSINFTGIREKSFALLDRAGGSQRRGSIASSHSSTSLQPVEQRSELVSSALFRLIGVASAPSDAAPEFGSVNETPSMEESLVSSSPPPPLPQGQQQPNTPNTRKGRKSVVAVIDDEQMNGVAVAAAATTTTGRFRAEDQTKLNIFTLHFESEVMERRYHGSQQQRRLQGFASKFWALFLLSLVACHLLFVCLSSTSMLNKFLTAAIVAISVVHCAVVFQRFTSADPAQTEEGEGLLGSTKKRSDSGRATGAAMSGAQFKVFSVLVYNSIAVVSSFLDPNCDAKLDTVFYTAQVIGMYYLCALLATQFLLMFTFWQRNALNVMTMAIAYAVTGMRRAWIRDEVMIFEISYALAVFAVSCLSYFGEYSARSAFAAQHALRAVFRDAKTQQFDLTANALNLMLPTFVVDALVHDGNQMFLHANISRDNTRSGEPNAGSDATAVAMAPNTADRARARRRRSVLPMREQLHEFFNNRGREDGRCGNDDDCAGTDDGSATKLEHRSVSDADEEVVPEATVAAQKQHVLWEYEFIAVAFISFDVGTDDLDAEDVETVDATFRDIEYVLEDYGAIKIKTIGTTMLVVQGVDAKESLAKDSTSAAAVLHSEETRRADAAGRERFQMRCVMSLAQAMREVRDAVLSERWGHFTIGLSCGSCFGAVMGLRGLRLDVFGSSINLASRLQTTCANQQIQITKEVADICVQHSLGVTPQAPKKIKGLGEVVLYHLD